METLNPVSTWTQLQKTYYLIQVKKLILELGDRRERGQAFDRLLADFKISQDEIDSILLVDRTPNKTTKRLFEDIGEGDRAYILVSYLLILIADSFDSDEHLKVVTMFTTVFGVSVPNTIRDIELIFDDNPDIEFEFQAKKV